MLSLVVTQNVHTILLNGETKLENIHVNGREPVCALGLKMQMYKRPNLEYRSTPRCTVFVNCCHYHCLQALHTVKKCIIK